jgi:hypothetical protein
MEDPDRTHGGRKLDAPAPRGNAREGERARLVPTPAAPPQEAPTPS